MIAWWTFTPNLQASFSGPRLMDEGIVRPPKVSWVHLDVNGLGNQGIHGDMLQRCPIKNKELIQDGRICFFADIIRNRCERLFLPGTRNANFWCLREPKCGIPLDLRPIGNFGWGATPMNWTIRGSYLHAFIMPLSCLYHAFIMPLSCLYHHKMGKGLRSYLRSPNNGMVFWKFWKWPKSWSHNLSHQTLISPTLVGQISKYHQFPKALFLNQLVPRVINLKWRWVPKDSKSFQTTLHFQTWTSACRRGPRPPRGAPASWRFGDAALGNHPLMSFPFKRLFYL